MKRRIQGDTRDYLVFFLELMSRFPATSYKAIIAHSFGYYAFTSRFEYYEGNYNSGLTILDRIQSDLRPGQALNGQYSFSYIGSLEPMRQILDKWIDVWNSIPVLSLINQIPVYTWLFAIIAYILFKRRAFAMLIPVTGVLLIVMTCIASPVNGAFRYFTPVAASLPAGLCTLTQLQKQKKDCRGLS